jgi:hypothetical protein
MRSQKGGKASLKLEKEVGLEWHHVHTDFSLL